MPNRTQKKGLDSRHILVDSAPGASAHQLAQIYQQSQDFLSRPGARDFYVRANVVKWKGVEVGRMVDGNFVANETHKKQGGPPVPTIAEHLGVNFGGVRLAADGETIPSIARLGFEIELEKHLGGFSNVRGWSTTDDGSLRGTRIEYIFDGGAAGEEAERRIQAMHDYLEREPAQPTFRCSTHLHMDMQSADFNEVEKVVLAYMVFEDSFFDQHDRYRRTSNFCIPFMNNDWFAQFFGRRILGATQEYSKFANCSRWSKYSALNLNVLSQHGTIE